jgi:hypothetical protein
MLRQNIPSNLHVAQWNGQLSLQKATESAEDVSRSVGLGLAVGESVQVFCQTGWRLAYLLTIHQRLQFHIFRLIENLC